ncbi:M24 family metallopeptidase [Antarcticimicrobium luteum]|uniref:Aminopeptidase P family protein n=1 Tax=Antarcticimicrobium luteum TaxID=2547397 RepID=A0A4R5V050_9RHOB|nr:Xaa-Pro peptidase family protein [Antarcticimicrobium luteum]TDK45059.1 aminopeptidase P family protein [Antarcticimicrobium luteum]
MSGPARGFPASEYRVRVARAQARMAARGLAALLLTTEADLRYFSGFLTRFWESPTRPWFLIVPASGDPVAVIPAIGAALMARGWITDIRTWPAPDPEDDGVSLLADALSKIAGKGGRVGLPMGLESHLRMPLADWAGVQARAAVEITDDGGITRALRMVKSEAEIDRIRAACAVAGRAFARVPEIARAGVPLEDLFRRFQCLCLEEGADWVPYLAGAAEQGGYADVISPAGPDPLRRGDVLMLDTGVIRDGYFCDFDRNFSVGPAGDAVRTAHAALIDATQEAAEAAAPGRTAAELFGVLHAALSRHGTPGAGRLGHGLGMQLTEGLSLIPGDRTVLAPGMVITLEPGLSLGPGRLMVHEENIVIRETGAEFLSPPAGREIVTLEG